MSNIKTLYALLLAGVLASGLMSCNKKDGDSNDSYVYTTSTSSALVREFELQANAEVMAGLDSVFFTIDPERGLIYNADSLPVGTDVSALKVTVSFRSPVSKAVFSVLDEHNVSTEYTYTSSMSDALDFRHGVTLTVTSTDGLRVMAYNVKVNVHKTEPDSLVWPTSARRNLPGAADDNYAVGSTSMSGDQYWCLLHHQGGYTMSHAGSPAGPWSSTKLADDFAADATTLTASAGELFVLGTDGQLLTSTDGLTWTAVAGARWSAIIGNYETRLLGLATGSDGKTRFVEHPAREGYEPAEVAADFPVKRFSQLLTVGSDWAVAPQAILVGGLKADGTPSSATWAYDGQHWAKINSSQSLLPALEGPTLLSYYTHTLNTTNQRVSRRVSWLVMGGRRADGTLNTTTYVSNNQGITWARGASSLSQSTEMPPFYCAQALVYEATLAQGAVQWQCPYIYLVGGLDSQGQLLNSIWQGVLPRMTFVPLN